ncbi:MAG TPA: 6-hydroxymethylpterin diphosphokinase MptE-like protein [candidate division Zixibacteria bacterium]|nr:6-hydroxymethylpterin diphosphokinase MptE-like protein [candidate division Zixibacteria bacterium]
MKHKQLAKEDYRKICTLLAIDPKTDENTTNFLNKQLAKKSTKRTLGKLKKIIEGKSVFVYGAGPTLIEGIIDSKSIIRKYKERIVIIAVDGATKALLEEDISIDIIISDLDGGFEALLRSYENNQSVLVIHGHGDNKEKLISFIPKLGRTNIIGTTQTKETKFVKNLGGFTDGDRAVFLAANLSAKNVFLFAFDFGAIVGKYSKSDEFSEDFPASKRKLIKLDIAKKLLAKVPFEFPKTSFYNCTVKGEEIQNIPKISFKDLNELFIES